MSNDSEEFSIDREWIDSILEPKGNSPLSFLLIVLAVLSVAAFCTTFIITPINPIDRSINSVSKYVAIGCAIMAAIGLGLCAIDFLFKGHNRVLTNISIVIYVTVLIGLGCFGILLVT